MFHVKPARDIWLAYSIGERAAALLQLVPEVWGELEHYGLRACGRGRVLLFQASPSVMRGVLDKARRMKAWKEKGVFVVAAGDRVQLQRAITGLESLLERMEKRQ